jgi:hypothetical protein
VPKHKWDHHGYRGASLVDWSGHVAIRACSRTRPAP